jgi:hypothetical protein
MASGLLVLGSYDIAANWNIEAHDIGSENLSFTVFDSPLEDFDININEEITETRLTISPIRPTTWPAFQSNYRALLAELRKDTNTLVLRAPNTDEIFVYDTFRSPVPTVFNNNGAAASVTHNVILELGIRRRPYARTDTLLAAVNKLSNSWPLKEGATAGRPLNWTVPVTTNVTNESIDNDGAHATLATTGARNWQQTTAVGSYASGDVVTHSFYVQASAPSIARARGAVQFKQSDGTTNVGSEHVGTLTAIGTSLARISVTTTAAGALTSRALVSIRFENSVATAVDVNWRMAQAEKAPAPSEFRLGPETLVNDPAGNCVLPVWNPGDADARADIVLANVVGLYAKHQLLVVRYAGDDVSRFINQDFLIRSTDASGGLDRQNVRTVRATGVAGASGGDTMVTTFASSSFIRDMQYYGFTDPLQRGLFGETLALFGRFAGDGGVGYQAQIGIAWSSSPAGDPGTLLAPVAFSGLTSGRFFDVFLGNIPFESRMRLDLYLSRSTSTGTLQTDCLYVVPLDSMGIVDLTYGTGVRLNAHETFPARSTLGTSVTGPSVTQGNIPVIPPGLSALLIRQWEDTASDEGLEVIKASPLSDTIPAYVDITPQRHQ